MKNTNKSSLNLYIVSYQSKLSVDISFIKKKEKELSVDISLVLLHWINFQKQTPQTISSYISNNEHIPPPIDVNLFVNYQP